MAPWFRHAWNVELHQEIHCWTVNWWANDCKKFIGQGQWTVKLVGFLYMEIQWSCHSAERRVLDLYLKESWKGQIVNHLQTSLWVFHKRNMSRFFPLNKHIVHWETPKDADTCLDRWSKHYTVRAAQSLKDEDKVLREAFICQSWSDDMEVKHVMCYAPSSFFSMFFLLIHS